MSHEYTSPDESLKLNSPLVDITRPDLTGGWGVGKQNKHKKIKPKLNSSGNNKDKTKNPRSKQNIVKVIIIC